MRREQREAKAVHGSIGLEEHPDVGTRLLRRFDPPVPDVVDAGMGVLYQPAARAHRQKEHGIPPGDLAAPGGEEDLRAAAFGIACDVGHVRASELVQMREEAPKDGIFSCDVGGQVIAAVDAVADAFGEQRPVGRKHLSPVVTTGRMAVQRGEKRANRFGRAAQLLVRGVGREPLLEHEQLPVSAGPRQGQTGELDAERIVYPLAHLTGIGTRQAERVPSQACKNGILYGLPPFKVSRQFFGRQVVQAPYFGQVPAVGVGRIVRAHGRRFAVSAPARREQEQDGRTDGQYG